MLSDIGSKTSGHNTSKYKFFSIYIFSPLFAIFIFILPPSMSELRKRLVNRGTDSKEKVLSRFKTAYQEINEVTKYNYVVVNDDIDKAVRKVDAILISERCRVDRIEDIYLDNMEEEVHELLVDKNLGNEERVI